MRVPDGLNSLGMLIWALEIYRIVSSKALEGAGQEPNLKGFTLSDSETGTKEKADKGCCA